MSQPPNHEIRADIGMFPFMKTLTALALALAITAGPTSAAQASPAPTAPAGAVASAEAAAGPRFAVDINASRSAACRPLRPACTVIFWVSVTNTGTAATTAATRPQIGMSLDSDWRILEVSNAGDVYPQVGNIRAILWPTSVTGRLAPGASHLFAVTARVRARTVLDPDPTVNHPFPAFTDPTAVRAIAERDGRILDEDSLALRFRP
jgi:hypothetical protein